MSIPTIILPDPLKWCVSNTDRGAFLFNPLSQNIMQQITFNFLIGAVASLSGFILAFFAFYLIMNIDYKMKNIRQLRHVQVVANCNIIMVWAKDCQTLEQLNRIRKEAQQKFTRSDLRRKENKVILSEMRSCLGAKELELHGYGAPYYNQMQGEAILSTIPGI